GKDSNTNDVLTGEELKSQLLFNGFQGVITETGSDYIEVTVRGSTVIDNMVKTRSEVQDEDPNCN
ncbi:MAG TPA: hypothetical protein VKA27_01745, partial [Sunxiuqinia sp.]|nr:hypothetical protein [Sunxiuqinia sp.]